MILLFFILFLIVAVGALVIYYFRNKNVAHYHTTQILSPGFSNPLTLKNLSGDYDEEETPLNTVFHNFNHSSYKDWLIWINKQDSCLKQVAFEKLVDHLLGPPKHWGFITHEVLYSIAGFRTQESFEVLVKFFRLTRRMWNDYKSVPRYYGITAKVLVELDPEKGLAVLNQEFQEVSSGQQSVEKKLCILEALSALPNKSKIKDFMTGLVSDKDETTKIRSKALELVCAFERGDRVESFKSIMDSFYARNKFKVENSDTFTFQEFAGKVVHFIEHPYLHETFKKLLGTKNLGLVLSNSIQELILKSGKLTPIKLFSICKINNNISETLSQALAQNAGFSSTEREAYLGDLIPSQINYEYLTGSVDEFSLPIPRSNESEYSFFKEIFLQASPNNENSKSKSGLMLTGSLEYKKLYYARAVSLERRWRFIYINVEEVKTKEIYTQLHSRLNDAPKPCVIYIDNVYLLFKDDESSAVTPRQKLLQTLQIQALDKRCFIAGSLPSSLTYSKESSSINLIQKIENNLLKNSFNVDENEEEISKHILSSLVSQLASTRYENEQSGNRFIEEMKKEYSSASSLELYFHGVKMIQYMLFSFKQLCPLDKIKLFEDKLSDPTADISEKETKEALPEEGSNGQENSATQELNTSTPE